MGIAGNVLVLVVIVTQAHMQTTTNMYILNMAAADILMCLGKEIYQSWDSQSPKLSRILTRSHFLEYLIAFGWEIGKIYAGLLFTQLWDWSWQKRGSKLNRMCFCHFSNKNKMKLTSGLWWQILAKVLPKSSYKTESFWLRCADLQSFDWNAFKWGE